MTDSLSSYESAQTAEPIANRKSESKNRFVEPVILIRRMAFGIAIATWMVMAIGSATRVMNAGLACPDWPLCYGTVLPAEQMNLQVFLEWFHRLVASSVGFATIVLFGASWYFRQELPKWLPWATSGSLSLVVFQGILGGLTVTQLLRFDIVTAHLGTGLLFFSSLLAIATALKSPKNSLNEQSSSQKLAWLGLTAALLVYLQSILGALVASQWALHQCFASQDMCIVLNAHLIGVIPATLASIALVVTVWLIKAIAPILRLVGSLAGLLVFAQVAIGYATYKLHLQVEPLTIAHQATGSALLGTLICFTVLAFRSSQKATQPSEQIQAQPAIR
ncbi:heme A synthase [Pseudanabaena sp. FACHB-1998]|uniref:COX15/CtaA family protein n=1 Tax=Pseudanabaena sp. FACHB-1998 TaxID=2692858 RepID=UPI00168195C4|nr:heme A synthase [Pseudanabaena sp. FACHB-1998]MBD2178319.1 heme A synthase [Pseudanabaena sp. FACHB-1998]